MVFTRTCIGPYPEPDESSPHSEVMFPFNEIAVMRTVLLLLVHKLQLIMRTFSSHRLA